MTTEKNIDTGWPNGKVRFEVTEEHITLFKRLCMEPSASINDMTHKLEVRPKVGYKRPFGSSDVIESACYALGYVDSDGAISDGHLSKTMRLIAELPVAIECFALHNTIAPGVYMADRNGAWFHYVRTAMALFWRNAIETCAEQELDADDTLLFVLNTPARDGNPYYLLTMMREFFSGTQTKRRILKIFEDEAVRRYEIAHGHPGHDRDAVLVMLKTNTAGMSWPGYPFVQDNLRIKRQTASNACEAMCMDSD